MKKIVALIITAAILLTTVTATPDANTEREADIFDTLEILKHLADIHPNKAAELFGREDFTIFDVLSILKGLIGLDEAVRVYAWLKPEVTSTAETTTTTLPKPKDGEIDFQILASPSAEGLASQGLFLARSRKELTTIFDKIYVKSDNRKCILETVKGDYFKDKAIIVINEGVAGSFIRTINSLVRDGDRLILDITIEYYSLPPPWMVSSVTMIEVNKNDVHGIKKLMQKTEKTWKSSCFECWEDIYFDNYEMYFELRELYSGKIYCLDCKNFIEVEN